MFEDADPKKPLGLDDLSTEHLQKLLDGADMPADAEFQAGPQVQ